MIIFFFEGNLVVYLTAAERLNRAEATRKRDILRPTQARKGK